MFEFMSNIINNSKDLHDKTQNTRDSMEYFLYFFKYNSISGS